MRIALGWNVSSFTGWGVYGLNLALQWARYPNIEACSFYPIAAAHLQLDPLSQRVLLPFLERSGKVAETDIFIPALGNDCRCRLVVLGGPRIAAIFFESPLSRDAVERAKSYDLIITGSRWNEEVLRSHGVNNVCTILQGVERSLFHPAPKRGLYQDKFLIFSGGKAEPRKGQDIVAKAFRIFAERHPDAMLVTAWHSPWPQLRDGMGLDLSDLADRVIDVGALPNMLMAQIYRECDVTLFPNRAEGGTNLVAMECIACGLPTILSANTGHMDLLDRGAGYPLKQQRINAAGWGESDLEEVVETLELAKQLQWKPQQSNTIADLTWTKTANEMLDAILPLHR
jgi:glycosyltransferase involved in cell wall biosynthesis